MSRYARSDESTPGLSGIIGFTILLIRVFFGLGVSGVDFTVNLASVCSGSVGFEIVFSSLETKYTDPRPIVRISTAAIFIHQSYDDSATGTIRSSMPAQTAGEISISRS